MKSIKVIAFLILLTSTGCVAPGSGADTNSGTVPSASSSPAIASQPSASTVPSAAASATAQSNPSTPARSDGLPTAAPSVRASLTILPSMTLATAEPHSTPSAPNGWKAYTGVNTGAALKYPQDWTAREDSAGATFVSPAGIKIVLARVETSGASPENYLSEMLLPNMRCASGINSHGMTVFSCQDTISFARTAYLFIKGASGAPRLWALSTAGRGNLDVYVSMIETVQPAT